MNGSLHAYNGSYRGAHLDRVAFPLGGMGAGMVCLEGAGGLSHVSVRNRPEVHNQPPIFAALCVHQGKRKIARVLEGPVPTWKVMFPWGRQHQGSGSGGGNTTFGLPRMASAEFAARFPFATVALRDPKVPLEICLTGWSPFLPGSADQSSLPAAGLEYAFHNTGGKAVKAVFSFHAPNFMRWDDWGDLPADKRPADRVRALDGGFVLEQDGCDALPHAQGAFAVAADDPETKVNCAWFRGWMFDARTLVWKSVAEGQAIAGAPYAEGPPSPGGSLYVPIHVAPGETRTVRLRLCWYVPHTNLRVGKGRDDREPESPSTCSCAARTAGEETHVPWYAGRFESIAAVAAYWRSEYDRLRAGSKAFSDCFHDTTLPPEVVEAVAANLTILKSPTVLRQTDGRLWAWEGCCDEAGCCRGSCTHVWNYAQALPHLFPDLERSLRETEFHENQDASGHQQFRACLPIRATTHDFHAAADGQLGGIMKVYREWRASGDTGWLRDLWPKVRQSLDFCIEKWDPRHEGLLREPHHNTYDIEFWDPDGMCGSFYLGALKAAVAMGEALGDDVSAYRELRDKARAAMEAELYDGEYFFQQVQWTGLRTDDPTRDNAHDDRTPELRDLMKREGPRYQYGTGCLSDGVLGAWMAEVCGVGQILGARKVRSHLRAVFRYNFRKDLSEHANPQRPTYAMGHEAGLLLCSWPKGGEPSLPFIYSNEVWTGIEYQAASHLMMAGCVEEGLAIVRAARDRYDGRVRNPFNEYECGHWYARAMAGYALLQGLTGQRYDAVEKVLYLRPQVEGDWRAFLCTATGYGTVGMRNGRPFLDVKAGSIPVEHIEVLE